MTCYLIFSYTIDHKIYVEGYPLNNRPFAQVLEGLPTSIPWSVVERESRTQARKAAYQRWVRSDGVGFNKLALSPAFERHAASVG